MKRRNVVIGIAALAVAGGATTWVLTGESEAIAGPVYSGRDDGVAIKGADPVAYFTQGRAIVGNEKFTTRWNGAKWRFASAGNLAKFEADPAAYAPQYGGYCAYAAANGQKAKIEPEAWSIVDGKLYLNYDLPIRARWDANQAEYIRSADERWPKIAAE